jgi:hypothetical protein
VYIFASSKTRGAVFSRCFEDVLKKEENKKLFQLCLQSSNKMMIFALAVDLNRCS